MIHKYTGFIVCDKSFPSNPHKGASLMKKCTRKHEACNDRCCTIIIKFARGKRKETSIRSEMIGVGGM